MLQFSRFLILDVFFIFTFWTALTTIHTSFQIFLKVPSETIKQFSFQVLFQELFLNRIYKRSEVLTGSHNILRYFI